MTQATILHNGTLLRRWYVYTDQGRKTVWHKTSGCARAKAEARGMKVQSVRPAGSPHG